MMLSLEKIEEQHGTKNINLFASNAPFLYPLKTSENLTVFLCFQAAEKGCIGSKWVKNTSNWGLQNSK